jgi:hypothetical protein
VSADTIQALQDDHFSRWKNREAIAETMIPMIGKLYRERNVIVAVYGRSLINNSVIQILKSHRRVRMIAGDLSVVDTFPLLSALAKLDLGPCVVDIGKLAIDLREAGGGDVDAFVQKAVAPAVGRKDEGQATDIVLFGFGRIGRMLARLLVEPSSCARPRRATCRSAPPCCAATPCTVPSTAPSPWMKRTRPSSPTATSSRSSTPPSRKKSTTPSTASAMPSSSTIPAS